MTPKEALQLLDNAVAELVARRVDHINLQVAINILTDVIEIDSKQLDKKKSKKQKK